MAKPTTAKPPISRLTLVPSTDARRQQAKPLGRSDAGPARTVALKVADARHHTHVVGVTGSGKSTLLINLILADIAAGRGVAVLDPKGDLVNDVLDRLPTEALTRLVLIDPAQTDAPAALNVLDTTDRTSELVVDQLVGVFARLYAAYWGPRTDDVMRSACLTLTRRPGATFGDIPLLLSNAGYRRTFTAGLSDPAGLGGFWSWYDALSDASRSQVIGPVMNKLRAVLSRSFAADLLGSSASTFSLPDILDGGILLARLPKGIIGDDTTRLVGSLLLSGLWQAATARAHQPETARADAAVYVDECHNFLHLPGSLDDILAEARGYHLGLTVAHQHLGQLSRDMADSIAANARNKIIFAVSPDDARVLARHVGPYLTADDLTRLDRYQAACRLVVDSRDTTGFTVATVAATPFRPGAAQAARRAAASRGRSTTDRRRDQLARRWTPPEDSAITQRSDRDTTETVPLPVSAQVRPAVSTAPLDTPTDTGGSELPPAQVTPAEDSVSDKSDSWENG
jgi:hypothetical protein